MGQVGLHCATANSSGNIRPCAAPCPHPWPPDRVAITTTTICTCFTHESSNPAARSYGSWASTSPSSGCTPPTGDMRSQEDGMLYQIHPPPAPEFHDTTPPEAPTSSPRCAPADSSSTIPRMLTRLLPHNTPGLCKQDIPASDLTPHMLRSHR